MSEGLPIKRLRANNDDEDGGDDGMDENFGGGDDFGEDDPTTPSESNDLDSAAHGSTIVVGSASSKTHPPSRVVHIRNLNDQVTEPDVKRELLRFGHINKTLFMYRKRQALVEYEELQSAVKCVTEAAKSCVRIVGTPVYINYSPYNNLTKHEYA